MKRILLAVLSVFVLIIFLLSNTGTAPATEQTQESTSTVVNLLGNGEFTEDILFFPAYQNVNNTKKNWLFAIFDAGAAAGRIDKEKKLFVVEVKDPGRETWNIQILQAPLTLQSGATYQLSFKAWASKERTMKVFIGNFQNWTPYLAEDKVPLTTEKKTYIYEFTIKGRTDENVKISFEFGKDTGTIYIANVKLIKK